MDADTLAKDYIEKFWYEKPQPIKEMIAMGFKAGMHGLRGQAAITAMGALIPECKSECFNNAEKITARKAVKFADALMTELNG